jgi:nucleoside 2-deoxyribosyltransferase
MQKEKEMKSIYLAHPHKSADYVKAVLQPIIEGWGFKVLNPFENRDPMGWYKKKDRSKHEAEKLVRLDIDKIVKSDMVVVYAPFASTGKSMETLIAFQQRKIVVVWDNISFPSNPWFVAHATEVVRSLDELKESLEYYKNAQ